MRSRRASALSFLIGVATCMTAARPSPALANQGTQSPRAPVPGAPTGVTAFVDVAVVPMDVEQVLPHHTVLIENGWITALGPVDQVKVPAGATTIDGRGKYLLPGLADMHAHVYVAAAEEPRTLLEAERRLLLWVGNGVTTVRNVDYNSKVGGPAMLRLRGRSAAGEILSPRIYTSGMWWRDVIWGHPPPPDSVAPYVAAYKAAGYDFIKLHDESPEVLDSVSAAARRVGMPIMGHAAAIGQETPEDVVARAAKLGYSSIEHLTAYTISKRPWLDTTRFRTLAEATKRAGIWNCPTLSLFSSAPSDSTSALHSNTSRSFYGQLTKALQDAGAGLLLGTDVPPGSRPPYFHDSVYSAVHTELQLMVNAGLTPYQALATGTRNVAAYFGTTAETGTIAAGKRADLLLLQGNPLQDIRSTRQPAGVMLGGRWLTRDQIDRRLAAMADSIAKSP